MTFSEELQAAGTFAPDLARRECHSVAAMWRQRAAELDERVMLLAEAVELEAGVDAGRLLVAHAQARNCDTKEIDTARRDELHGRWCQSRRDRVNDRFIGSGASGWEQRHPSPIVYATADPFELVQRLEQREAQFSQQAGGVVVCDRREASLDAAAPKESVLKVAATVEQISQSVGDCSGRLLPHEIEAAEVAEKKRAAVMLRQLTKSPGGGELSNLKSLVTSVSSLSFEHDVTRARYKRIASHTVRYRTETLF